MDWLSIFRTSYTAAGIKSSRDWRPQHRLQPRKWRGWLLYGLALAAMGCAGPQPLLVLDNLSGPTSEGTIWDTRNDRAIDFDTLMAEVAKTRVLYIGERHTDPDDHRVQLEIIQGLVRRGLSVTVGMEMFDQTYQAKLDKWTAGQYDWPTFLNETHWYANWKYDAGLYRDILEYIRSEKIRLIGLNIPFWIPPKIATGGLDSLSPQERALLPAHIDTGNAAHRAYIEKIFKMHHLRGRENFDYFYQAQCAWEDGMAQAIADHLDGGIMVVLAGNGHIQDKFGVPDRAFERTKAPFKTIYLASAGDHVDRQTADYIWAVAPTEADEGRTSGMRHHPPIE